MTNYTILYIYVRRAAQAPTLLLGQKVDQLCDCHRGGNRARPWDKTGKRTQVKEGHLNISNQAGLTFLPITCRSLAGRDPGAQIASATGCSASLVSAFRPFAFTAQIPLCSTVNSCQYTARAEDQTALLRPNKEPPEWIDEKSHTLRSH